LYQKKMPCHREFHLARFENERKRLDKKCGDALALLDRILSGMLDEEVTQLQHAHDEDEHILTTPHHHHHDMIMSSEPPAKDAVALALEARLLALKRRNSVASSSTPSVEAAMRHMAIPSSLVAEFTRLAASNTSRLPYGVETCGILAGSLKDQRLSITTLIIPKQEGSSDTCTMTHEEDLFEYCIQHDLLTLGWIHTHPSQTCFLSSVDIHTQCGFQSMLSEVHV
ncbi:hypothetical protein DYB35_013767, partial [Aphanomyces astaci]